jgi:hypothetical protein
MSGIIWHQLPKDLIKVICEFAKDNPQPTALSFFLANSDKINWGSLSRNPANIPLDTFNVAHWHTRPNVNELITSSANISRINWDLLSNNIRQEERQIKPVQTKHDALLMRLALLMQIKF